MTQARTSANLREGLGFTEPYIVSKQDNTAVASTIFVGAKIIATHMQSCARKRPVPVGKELGAHAGRLGDLVAKHQAVRALMARVQAGEGAALMPDPPLAPPLPPAYGGTPLPGLPGLPSPARAADAPAPGLTQARPRPHWQSRVGSKGRMAWK